MEAIKTKIQELLQVSAVNLIGDKDFGKKFDAKMKQQEELMDELKTLALAKKTIIGRVIQLQRCDGYALYLITDAKKGKATVKWLDWCDGYMDDILDYGCELPIEKAFEFVRRQDKLDELFSNKKLTNV